MRMSRIPTILVLLGSLAAPIARAEGDAVDPWSSLERLRDALAHDGQLLADFQQSYLPAGFSSGDTESGEVALSMPDCLRWDYSEPYRKSFLVCGDRAWSWVEGEPRGQRFTIESDREMGLDLLLLPSSELSRRYRAHASTAPGGELELSLEPVEPSADLVVADLRIAAGGRRPVALEWRDHDGNVTSFRFGEWRALEKPSLFDPPAHLEWSDPSAAGSGLR